MDGELLRLRGLSNCRLLSVFYGRLREFSDRGPGERFGVECGGVVLWSHCVRCLREEFVSRVRGFVAGGSGGG